MQSGRQWYARIFGLERLAVVDRATGRYDFAEVPAGQYSLRLTATGEGTAPVTVEGVVAPPGDTVRLAPFSAWKFSRTLLLNTTSTGAGVTEDVLGFPVLIRLKPDNFDFSRAKSGGADLRFMKPDNTPLPYEIEQWDSSAGRAALWVRVDTVRGGTPSNIILMFWGNPNAAAAGKGCAVFDTANGYCGVWHLANCDDATSHARNGTGSGLSDTAGIIGRCQYFSGGGYAKIPGLAGTPAAMTLSAWANLDTVQGVGSEVVSVGDAALIRMDDSWHGKGTQGAYFVDTVTDADSTHCVAKSGLFFKKTGWHFLTYTIDPRAGIERLFIDSLPAAVTASPVPIVYGGVGSDVYFGKHGNDKPGFNFTGAIDEVRIASVVRSQGWIRLSYMNQRPDDRLVVWK
jgi:biopolymer transport protein ExbB